MKNQIVEFLRNNIIGRILYTDDVIYYLENGKLEGVYSDKMIFSDLTITENGFQFNMTTVTEEQVYTLDSEKKRDQLVKDFTGTSVFHYRLALRKSTNRFTGFVQNISSTVEDHTMEAVVYGVYNMELENQELKWKENQLLYRDMPSEDKTSFRAVAFDSNVRFYMENGKVVFEYLPVYWNVDPVTMKKTLSKDKYPPFVSKEK